jgi:hypothetical protein
MARLAVLCMLSVALLGACGGNDKKDVETTLRDFVKATNDRDTDKFCKHLVTKQFLEQTTGASGDDAKGACAKQLKALKRPKLRLIRIEKIRVDGDKATAQAVLDIQGQPAPQQFRLKKDGDWRVAGGSGG